MNDVIALLEADHRHVEHLLAKLAESEPGPERNAMVEQLSTALRVHMQFEEQELYPLVARIDGEMAEEAGIEHGLARDGVTKLAELAGAPGFGAAVEMLAGGISHHVREEEGEMFPKVRSSSDAATLDALGRALQQAKAAAGLPPFDPESVTKTQLLEFAREAGIEGRSKMTKQELQRALS
jgi:hemerythrin superfamily protein